MQDPERKMRNELAETLKAALLFLVIVGHVFLSAASEDRVKGAIYLFHMPLFLALSGYFFDLKRGPLREAARAWSRYLRPWVISTAVFFVFLFVTTGKAPFGLWKAVADPWYHLWFVPALFLFAIAATLVRNPFVLFAAFSIPLGLRWLHASPPFEDLGIDFRYAEYGIFFATGLVVRRCAGSAPKAVWFAALLLGLILIPKIYPYFLAGTGVDVVRLLLCIGVIGLVASYPRAGGPWGGANLYSRESLAIYLYHPIPILIAKAFEPSLGVIPYWALALCGAAIVVPLAAEVCRRVAPFAPWVLGSLPMRSGGATNPTNGTAKGAESHGLVHSDPPKYLY